MQNEPHEIRIKRLKMRSWRRGMKEMDLILGPFSDNGLNDLNPDMLDLYEDFLNENDQELYSWFTGHGTPPQRFIQLIEWLKASSVVTTKK